MVHYVLNRIVAMALTLFIVLSLMFVLIRIMPMQMFDDPELSEQMRESLMDRYHLNKPMYVQYYYFVRDTIVRGDWGTSIKLEANVPVFTVLAKKVEISMAINFISLLISLPLGIVAGILAAVKKNKMSDHVISLLVVLFISVPSFIFASLLQYLIGFKLSLLPLTYQVTGSASLKIISLILPITALMLGPTARVARYLRAELTEALNSDYILLARTKGLTRSQTTVRHAIRNSLVPLANIIIPMLTGIMGGSLVVERIFSIPGAGGLMIDAINAGDYPLIIAVLLFYTLVSLVTMLVVDLSYGLIDPRIRIGSKK